MEEKPKYAEVFVRFIARIVDLIWMACLSLILSVATAFTLAFSLPVDAEHAGYYSYWISLLIIWIYTHIITLKNKGHTPGKK